MLLKNMLVKVVFVYCSFIGFVSAGSICREAPGKSNADWRSPDLPERATDQSSQLAGYCKTNPHAFDRTSASLPRPINPLQCYVYKTNGLALELPNGLFCEGRPNNYLDSLVSRYASSLATYYMSGFELVIYNKKHRLYQRIVVNKDHNIFDKIKFSLAFRERVALVYKKISSGEYPQQITNCAFMEKTSEGEDCPSEITDFGPILPSEFLSLKDYYEDPISPIKHEELK